MTVPTPYPRPGAPPAVPAPAAPPTGLVLARWAYVDEAHRHEVHAGVRPGAKPAFVVKESAFQNADPTQAFEEVRPIEWPWEAQLYHWQLEGRLSLMGRYWKHDASEPGWRPLVPPQGAPQVDLRPVATDLYRGRVAFHHFHPRKQGDDVLLVSIPTATADGARHLLARANFRFPHGADADIQLLHAHLPEAPARSLLLREHLALRERAYDKLVWGHDLARAHGDARARELAVAYGDVLQRIHAGSFGAVRHARGVVIDPVYTDFVRALTDPRMIELQARYLTHEEEAEALAGGEVAIRRLVTRKRERAPRAEQHMLTLVEASLLARDQLRPGQRARVDPEVAALVRRFAYYL